MVWCFFSCVHSQKWGFEMKYKEIALLPNLAIKNFALETPDGRLTIKKWKDVPFTVEEFSFEEYCQKNFPGIFDWLTNSRICGAFLPCFNTFLNQLFLFRAHLEKPSSSCSRFFNMNSCFLKKFPPHTQAFICAAGSASSSMLKPITHRSCLKLTRQLCLCPRTSLPSHAFLCTSSAPSWVTQRNKEQNDFRCNAAFNTNTYHHQDDSSLLF